MKAGRGFVMYPDRDRRVGLGLLSRSRISTCLGQRHSHPRTHLRSTSDCLRAGPRYDLLSRSESDLCVQVESNEYFGNKCFVSNTLQKKYSGVPLKPKTLALLRPTLQPPDSRLRYPIGLLLGSIQPSNFARWRRLQMHLAQIGIKSMDCPRLILQRTETQAHRH